MNAYYPIGCLFFAFFLGFAPSTNGQSKIDLKAMQHIRIVPKPKKAEDMVLTHIGKLQTALDSMTANAQAFYNSMAMPDAAGNGVTYYNVTLTTTSVNMSYANLLTIQAELQGDLDAMNEMSEMTSMRLQMALDRRSKLLQTLSNIEKKVIDMQNAIVKNLK
jgi:hypothetical protein